MSYYDDSSLFVAPNGYKASVLFAQKPMDANGQLAFTRSNDTATRVASNGLIEKVRTNLLLQSGTFSNAAWTKLNTTYSGDTLTAVGGLTSKFLFQAQAQQGLQTIYFDVAYVNHQFVQVFHTSGGADVQFANFDILNKIVTTFGGGALNATLQDFGSFVRIALVLSTTTKTTCALAFIDSATAARGASSASTGSIKVFNAQNETGDIATDYIATTTAARSVGPVANIPRIDYLGGGCGKLLLEGQRTNSFQFSESFDNAYWTKQTCVVTANTTQTLDPSGYNGADFVVTNNGAASGVIQRIETITANQPLTLSVFLKYQGVPIASINCRDNATAGNNAGVSFNIQTGVISTAAAAAGTCSNASATITNYGNGWYRCTLTFTNSATTSFRLRWYNDGVGNGVNGTFGWGFQLEQNASYATSYVNTLAASVTRGADACSKTGISSLIGQTEGTLFAEVDLELNVDSAGILGILGTTGNFVYLFKSLTTNTLLANVFVSSVAQASISYALPSAGRYKIALAYKANDFVLYVNGIQRGSDNSGSVPVCTDVTIPAQSAYAVSANSKHSQAIVFKTRLPNSELASLTTL